MQIYTGESEQIEPAQGSGAIVSFQYPDKTHSPLSNFYPSPIIALNVVWPTVEHIYQAMKSLDENEREFVRTCGGPGDAKRAGRKITLRSDWEEVKLQVMRHALVLKFPSADEELGRWLLNTGDVLLVEGNTWGDRFWGVDGTGQNWLGVLLMTRRAELRSGALVTF